MPSSPRCWPSWSGITLAAVGLLRAGWLATLLSIPVTTGFLAGISIHIIVSQLPDLLGVPETDGHMLVQLVHILGQLGAANLYTLALGAGVLVVTLGDGGDQPSHSRRADRPRRCRPRRRPVPSRGARRRRARRAVGAAAAPRHAGQPRHRRMEPAGAAGARGRHGLHHADGGGGERVSVGPGRARRYQPRLPRRRRGQHPRRDWSVRSRSIPVRRAPRSSAIPAAARRSPRSRPSP